MSDSDRKEWRKLLEAYRRPNLENPPTTTRRSAIRKAWEKLGLDTDFADAFFGCLAALLLYLPFGLALAAIAAHIVSGS